MLSRQQLRGLTTVATGDLVVISGTSGSLAVVADVAVGSILVSGGVNTAPTYATDIPTAVTIGSAYIYRVGGTDVSVADGGTGISSGTEGGIPWFTTTTAIATSALLAANAVMVGGGIDAAPNTITSTATSGYVLVAQGAGVAPVWSNTITGTFGGFTASRAIQSDASGNLIVATALPATIGGTGQTDYTIGDILYAASTTTVDKLAAVAVGQVLVSAGTGTAPAWSNSPSISALKLATVTKAVADTGYTALSTDFSIMWNAVGGACTQNLPAATGSGRVLEIKKIDASANIVTVDGDAAELIDGQATQTLTAQWEAITIQDTASGVWHIL